MIILYATYPFAPIQFPLQTLTIFICLMVLAAFVVVNVSIRVQKRRVHAATEETLVTNALMQKALKLSANNVVVYDLRVNYINRISGHLFPEEGIDVEGWKSHVHPADLPDVLDWFHQMIDGKLKEADFNYRWNMDYSGGRPRWGYMHNRSVAEFLPGMSRPISIISTLTDETELYRQQEEERELTQKYKLIFEHSIVGLSFYSPDGRLLDANAMMRKICHFDNDEGDSFFGSVNLFDIPPFNEIDRHHIEEFWVCALSVVPERDMYLYLEIRLHPIYDAGGNLIYLAVAARDVTEERELYLQAKLNDLEIQKVNKAIQVYETELCYMMENVEMRAWRSSFTEGTITFYKGLSTIERIITFKELATYFQDDPQTVALHFANPAVYFTQPMSYMGRMRSIFHDSDEIQWNQINSLPVYDDEGNLIGGFGLIRNISGMMRKQEQLKRETERANDSGRMKSVFLANMTHEIRTPLNAIVGFSDLLQAIDQPDERREMIRIIHNNCDMLLRLVNDILVLSNVDANAMQIHAGQVDFAKEFDVICHSLAQRVTEPAVEFQKDNPYDSLVVSIDIGRIQQVITNFVTNAVKYTQQGHIRVGYHTQLRDASGAVAADGADPAACRTGLYVYCEDTGSGIPSEQLQRVFERFVKLNDYIQGTGLGLSICKAIIEKCDGQIGVESSENQGSTFWFWIPVTPQ
jgi:signal transduction histidine kinase